MAMNSSRPAQIFSQGPIVAADMIINQQSRAVGIVTHQHIAPGAAPDAQDFAGSLQRQQDRGYRFECLHMFCQSAVVRNQWEIQTDLQSDRPRVAKSPSSNESDAHSPFPSLIERQPVPLAQNTLRVEQSAVEIQC